MACGEGVVMSFVLVSVSTVLFTVYVTLPLIDENKIKPLLHVILKKKLCA